MTGLRPQEVGYSTDGAHSESVHSDDDEYSDNFDQPSLDASGMATHLPKPASSQAQAAAKGGGSANAFTPRAAPAPAPAAAVYGGAPGGHGGGGWRATPISLWSCADVSVWLKSRYRAPAGVLGLVRCSESLRALPIGACTWSYSWALRDSMHCGDMQADELSHRLCSET